jgi:hypothetical protein
MRAEVWSWLVLAAAACANDGPRNVLTETPSVPPLPGVAPSLIEASSQDSPGASDCGRAYAMYCPRGSECELERNYCDVCPSDHPHFVDVPDDGGHEMICCGTPGCCPSAYDLSQGADGTVGCCPRAGLFVSWTLSDGVCHRKDHDVSQGNP